MGEVIVASRASSSSQFVCVCVKDDCTREGEEVDTGGEEGEGKRVTLLPSKNTMSSKKKAKKRKRNGERERKRSSGSPGLINNQEKDEIVR